MIGFMVSGRARLPTGCAARPQLPDDRREQRHTTEFALPASRSIKPFGRRDLQARRLYNEAIR
jgi:hypothetical protein